MGDSQEDVLYHDGEVENSVVLSADELDGAGLLARTKILDELIKDCTIIGRIFRMVKTTAINIICTLKLIDMTQQDKQKPKTLAKNSAEMMQASFIKCDDNLDDTTQTQIVQRKIGESQPALEKLRDKLTLGLEEIYEVEMKWQRHKSKLVGPMVATRNAINKTTANINDLRTQWNECNAIMDSVMPKLEALKGNWGQNRPRQVIQ